MRACVASLLHVPLDSLPNPHGGLDWGLEWKRALAPLGVIPIWLPIEGFWDLKYPGYWIATVRDPDEKENRHGVVMLMNQLAHDPMPESIFLDYPTKMLHPLIEAATLLVPVDPSRGVVK